MSPNFKRRYGLLLLACLVVVPLDQWTKYLVTQHFELYQSRTIVQHYLNLVYVQNSGAAFGIFADSAIRVPFLSAIAILAIAVIVWILPRLEPQQRWLRLGLVLVLPGALGNLIDRLRFGAVIDFIDVHWYQYHWPAFNVADSAITLGVACMLLDLLCSRRSSN
ncbi:MAG: signal peptidase II [Desulfuromonadaceae bacterium]|nr:signal peptidase II [Desulfuromonadaceae bacterium]